MIALLAFGSCGANAAEQAHFPTNEDLRHLGSIGSPKISPDGRSVLLQVTESTADGAKSHLWLVNVEDDTNRQLTYSPESDKRGEHNAAWMPDGASILFLAHRGAHTQLFQLPMAGGEAKAFDIKTPPVADRSKAPDALPPAADEKDKKTTPADDKAKTDDKAKPDALPLDIGSFDISPDGKTIAILADDPETPGEKSQGEARADATWVDHDIHGTRLYLLDVASSKLTLTAAPIDVRSASWSHDSARLAVLTDEPHNMSDLRPSGAAWLLSVNDPAHIEKLEALPPTIEAATWSIDGKSIAFLAAAKEDTPPGYSDLYQYQLASKHITNASSGFSGSLGYGAPIALPDGTVVQAVAQGVTSTYAVAANGPLQMLHFATPVAGSLDTNAQQNAWVFLGQGGAQPVALYYTRKLDQAAHILHTPAVEPANLKDVAPKLIHWKNDGLTIEGLLYLPPQAETAHVPLVVDVHGGPLGAFEDRYDPFVQFLIGQGWAVLRTNPRGSSNYGAHFAAANKNDLGGGDYRDIMAGVDYALKNANLDPDRMALMGYSYGGEMAGFVEGSTNRFKAIICGAPVIDQLSEYGTESDSWYDRWYFGKPWEHLQDAWRQSPLSRVSHATTPFLLLQGDDDTTDPLGQSQEMYRALRQAGVPVDLVTYPRVNHGPLAMAIFGAPSTEPWHGFDARRRIVELLNKSFGNSGPSTH